MIESYFYKLRELEKVYGEKIILLWQCGDFMEVYGYKNPDTGAIEGSNILDFGKYCHCNVRPKSGSVFGKQLYFSGQPLKNHYDKYVPNILKEGYTVIELN